MDRSIEQRYAIKFCVKLGKCATETLSMLQQAYEADCLSKAQVFRWHKAFMEGREQVTDEARSGRPSTSRVVKNVERVRDCLNENRQHSLQLMAEKLNLSRTTVFRIVTEDLKMKKISARHRSKVDRGAKEQKRTKRTPKAKVRKVETEKPAPRDCDPEPDTTPPS